MRYKRFLRHLTLGSRDSRRAFPPEAVERLILAVRESERTHSGELRVAVEHSFDLRALLGGATPRDRAVELFSALRVWDTEENSGVLIYVNLAEQAVEIVADRGINARVPQEQWDGICHEMSADFAVNRFPEGVLSGLERIGSLLAEHFPARRDNPNELPDSPVFLG